MDVDSAKRAAAEEAAALVETGMTVGLGTGSTARWFTVALGRRVRQGIRVRVVATSTHTAALAVEHGLDLIDLDRRGVDIAVDGADCVDPDLRLIKGAGGALVREKIVGAAAKQFVIIVDASKISDQLCGRVPAEVVPFGYEHTIALLDATGAAFVLRTDSTGNPIASDNGNLLADATYGPIDDPEGLAARLDAIPGVVGHGLFLGMTDLVIVGRFDGSVELMQPRT